MENCDWAISVCDAQPLLAHFFSLLLFLSSAFVCCFVFIFRNLYQSNTNRKLWFESFWMTAYGNNNNNNKMFVYCNESTRRPNISSSMRNVRVALTNSTRNFECVCICVVCHRAHWLFLSFLDSYLCTSDRDLISVNFARPTATQSLGDDVVFSATATCCSDCTSTKRVNDTTHNCTVNVAPKSK